MPCADIDCWPCQYRIWYGVEDSVWDSILVDSLWLSVWYPTRADVDDLVGALVQGPLLGTCAADFEEQTREFK